jgi:predicted SAM-dependent methyltransferase
MRLLNLGCGTRHHPAWVNIDLRMTGPGVISYDLRQGSLPFAPNVFEAVYLSHLLEHFQKRYAPVLLRECYRVLKPKGIIRVVVPDLEQIARLYIEALSGALLGDEELQRRYEWIVLELIDQMVRHRSGGEMYEYWKQTPMPAEDFVIERLGSEVLNALALLRSPAQPASSVSSPSENDVDRESDPVQVGTFRLSGEAHLWMYDRYALGVLLQTTGFRHAGVLAAHESAIPDFNTYLLDIEPDGKVRKPDSLFMEARKALDGEP